MTGMNDRYHYIRGQLSNEENSLDNRGKTFSCQRRPFDNRRRPFNNQRRPFNNQRRPFGYYQRQYGYQNNIQWDSTLCTDMENKSDDQCSNEAEDGKNDASLSDTNYATADSDEDNQSERQICFQTSFSKDRTGNSVSPDEAASAIHYLSLSSQKAKTQREVMKRNPKVSFRSRLGTNRRSRPKTGYARQDGQRKCDDVKSQSSSKNFRPKSSSHPNCSHRSSYQERNMSSSNLDWNTPLNSSEYDIEYFPNSVNVGRQLNKTNVRSENDLLCRSASVNTNTDSCNLEEECSMEVMERRRIIEEFKSMTKSIPPSEIIMDYRQQIEKMSNDCTQQNLAKVEKISALMLREKAYEAIFKLHYNNLILQQKNFDAYISLMKHECSVIHDKSIEDIIRKADKIKMCVESECSLFRKTLPAYAYKSDILNALGENQVIIIPADSSYFFSIVVPIIIQSQLNCSVVSCESSNMSCQWIKNEIENIMACRFENCSSINCTFEDKMLPYLKDNLTSTETCFVLNVPLKRTITSDLVLAHLRNVLLQKKDSKLILILSIFDNIKNYQKYFSNIKVSLLEMPKLLLPIQTVWKEEQLSVTTNYKEDVVCTALSIHILNEPGDVIAFLPSLTDAKAALAMFQRKSKELSDCDVEGILLHENSTNVLRLKTPPETKRKIIFTTSCAEVLPLPSVRYVVDSGLTRDYIFDSEKNFDVLTTVFNSRAKAQLRKSLVGVHATGICYRIYSKNNFCINMSSFERPDILTLNPFNTLVKIFHHCPENALSTQFVEPLSDTVKSHTVKLLKNFNALKKGKLTQLGQKMVKLPFPARYSKLILQGIDWGFAYEAVILVAFFSVDSYLFKKTKDEEYQRVIDASKIELIQNESDPLSLLTIFKEWVENECNNVWCDERHIEYNTLNEIKLKVAEICQVVDQNLSENILQEFSNSADLSSNIIEMLFHCFADNLCVFSGHYRCGYRILSSRQTAFIHPSSILSNKETFPQLIIFNKIICTKRNFLLGITAIPSDLVLNSLTEKLLDFDYSDIFERTLVSDIIEKVGEKIINQVLLGRKGKKLQDIEEKIKKELNSDFVIIDPSAEKGCVYVYAMQPILKAAVSKVDQILKSNIEDVINAEQTYILELKKGQTSIPIEVKCVMGAKIISVKVKDILSPNLPVQNKLSAKPSKNILSSVQYSINLTWVRRRCNGICYVGFSPSSFMQARKLAMRNISILGSEVFVAVNNKAEAELMLSDVPAEARANDIEETLKKYLPNAEIIKVAPIFVKPFKTTEEDIQKFKIEIEDNCEEFTDLVDFQIIVPTPKDSSTIMTAFINVHGSEDLTEAAQNLSNAMIRNFKVNAIPVYRSVVKSSFKIYKALKSRIEGGISKLKSELGRGSIVPNRDFFRFEVDHVHDSNSVLLKLLCNDNRIMKRLQKMINELLEGEILNKSSVKDIHKLFCHGGLKWLRTLEKSKNVYILEEYNSKTIRVYGSQENCFKVKQCILDFLEDTENEAVETVCLSNEKNNRALLKSVIKEYGVNLDFFVEVCQLRSAVLDIKSCCLMLHGSRDSIDQAKNILNQLSSKLDSTEEYTLLCGGEMCPVCACPAFNLTIRLQHCGHLYCSECILGLVMQAQFPIQCCAENCSEDVVLDDIVRILDEDDEKIQKLLHSSLDNFLESNRSEIFYCPAPDCPMFAYKNDVSEMWKCPLCQNEICKKCNVIYHHGFTCDVYQGSKLDPDYSFKVWKKGTTQCKECPRCHTAIEKNKGCDHMTCTSCHSHFCWVCCREFPTDSAVYNHIPFCDQYPKW